MANKFSDEVEEVLSNETREGLLAIIRHCRAVLVCDIVPTSRAYHESLRDGATAKLDAIMRAEAELAQTAGRAKRLPE
jgi:hypothetical protein